MHIATANDLGALVYLVSQWWPSLDGPILVRILLWDGRVVTASYYQGERSPDALSLEGGFRKSDELELLINRLLEEGTPFVTETGSDDQVCTLEWTIAEIR